MATKTSASLFDRNAAAKYVADYQSELMKPNRYLGSWYDKGEHYLDTPEIHHDRKVAIALGHERDEIALYDLATQKPVYMMSDEQRPSESKGEKITESSSEGGTYIVMDPRKMTADEMVDAIMAQHGSAEDE